MQNNRLTTNAFHFVRLRTLTFHLFYFFFFCFVFSFFLLRFAFILIGTLGRFHERFHGIQFLNSCRSVGRCERSVCVCVRMTFRTWHFVFVTPRYMCTASAMSRINWNPKRKNAMQLTMQTTKVFNQDIAAVRRWTFQWFRFLYFGWCQKNAREYFVNRHFPMKAILWISLFELP